MVKSSIVEAVGNSPLLELKRIKEDLGLVGRIFAKVEFFNPGGSKKDRIAKYIIEAVRESGKLVPGQGVVEATSGNTGIGLAIVCAVYGHPFTAFISAGNSSERIQIMQGLGAKVVTVEQAEKHYGHVSGNDFNSVKERARMYAEENNCYYVNQFENPLNIDAQKLMGQEIFDELKEDQINIDLFCDYVGTAGSFTGCASVFKEHNPECHCHLVEPVVSPAVQTGVEKSQGGHIIQGGGYGYSQLSLLDKDLVDSYEVVTDQEALDGMHFLMKKEGIFGSLSSGANLITGIKLLQKEENRDKNLVIIVSDTGLKYFSNAIF